MLDGSGVKAMPGSIPTPNSGSLLKNKKIQVAKWGTPKKVLKKNNQVPNFVFEIPTIYRGNQYYLSQH